MITPSDMWPPTPGYDAGYLQVKVNGQEVPDEDLHKWESLFPPVWFRGKQLEQDVEQSCDAHVVGKMKVEIELSVTMLPHEVEAGK